MDLAKLVAQNEQYDTDYDFTQGQANRVQAIVKAKLNKNADYKRVNKSNQLVAGRSTAFGAVYDAILAYQEGHPVSGATLFTTLEKTRVYVPGLGVEANLKSFDSLVKDVVCGSEETKKSMAEVASVLKEATKPYLKDYIAQSILFETAKTEAIQQIISEGSVKRSKK